MMLERILNPGLQLSAKNDTVREQDPKHHCLCTAGKMPIQCFRIHLPPSARFCQRLSNCGNQEPRKWQIIKPLLGFKTPLPPGNRGILFKMPLKYKLPLKGPAQLGSVLCR